MSQVWFNGTLVEEENATVSVNDRSFRFGDGLFETIPIHEGIPYLWEYHAERLLGGLDALRIKYDAHNLLPEALKLAAANATQAGLLRIHISRGVGSRGYLPDSATPTIVMQTLALPVPPSAPVTLWLSSFEKVSSRALPTRFKLAQGLNSTLARMEASDHGCFDAILLDRQGFVCEASSANIFWRKNDKLYTPSIACGTLAGVTRRRVMELSPYPIREGSFTPAEMETADEVILTNAALGAIAAAKLVPGPASWSSAALANEINTLRNNDIKQYAAKFREALAQN